MTPNNYPEGLDELVERLSLKYTAANGFARALLDALAERGHVLVDAKKQEPVAYIAGYYKDVINGETDAIPLGAEVSFVNMNWRDQIPLYTRPAIPGRVALPDGWRMVPVEPTEKMRKAGSQHTGAVSATYRDMLSAAPTPPTQPQGDGSLWRDAERYRWLAKTSTNDPAYNEVWACWPDGDLGEAIDTAMQAAEWIKE